MVGRPRDPDVDARIVEATRSLLVEGGLDAVTIAAVSARAGVGRPSVYRRYPDREALALAVLFHDLQRRVADVAEDVPHDLPLLDQLCRLVDPIFAYYSENPSLSAALLELAMFSTGMARARLDTQLYGFLGGVAERIGEAIAKGELAPDADVRALVSAYFALYVTTAIGGVRGLLPEVEQQTTIFRAMLAQQLRGAGAGRPPLDTPPAGA